MNANQSRTRNRTVVGLVLAVAGIVVAIAGSAIAGIIMIVCGVLIAGLAYAGYTGLWGLAKGERMPEDDRL